MEIFLSFFLLLSLFFQFKETLVIHSPVPDQFLDKSEDLDYSIPDDSFINDDNSSIHITVSPNKWIKQTFINPIVENQYDFLRARDVFVAGTLCYVLDEKRILWIFDVSSIQPIFIGKLEFELIGRYGHARRLVVEEDYAYISGYEFLFVVDISTGNNPSIVGSYESYHSDKVFDAVVKGEYAYVADYDRLVVLDISDKTNPIVTGSQSCGQDCVMEDVFVVDDIAFVSCGGVGYGLTIFNVTDKTNLVVIGNQSTPGSAHSVFVKEDYAYIADRDNGINIIDIRDLSNPTSVSMYDTYRAYDIIVRGDVAFVADYLEGIKIINVSESDNPKLLTSFSTDSAGKIFLQGDFLFVGDLYFGFKIIDISNLANVTLVNRLQDNVGLKQSIGIGAGVDACGIFHAEDGNLYVAGDSYGIMIFDVSDRYYPLLIGKFKTTKAHHVVVYDNYAYVADYQSGLKIVDISNITNPVLTGSVGLESISCRVFVEGDFAFVADGVQGLKIVNVQNKSNPILVGKVDTYNAIDVHVKENFAYIADGENGLLIINVSNKSSPFIVGSHTIQFHTAVGVFVEDQYVFVAMIGDGIKIFDISDESTPVLIFSVFTDFALKVFVEGDFAFVADEIDGLKIIDISNIHSPKIISTVNTYDARDVYVKDNYIYVADHFRGVKVVRMGVKLIGSSDFSSEFCGETYVNVKAKDKTESREEIIRISNCDIAGRKICLPNNDCVCEEGFSGEVCESWSCFGIDFIEFSKVCKGHGDCKSPNKCDCRFGYVGLECQINTYYFTVMAPLLSFTGIIVCCCLFFTFFFVVCSSIVVVSVLFFCLCSLMGVLIRQFLLTRKFRKLKNLDILLIEQELEDDRSIAHLRIKKDLFKVNYSEIKVSGQLGEGGSNSVVYLAIWQKKEIAFKCFKTRFLFSSQNSYDEFEREVEILASISHPHIIRFFGATMDPPRVGILMEYCSNGDLDKFISHYKKEKNGESYPLQEKIRMLYEISTSLLYLHSRNIIHRDLKLENVLVDKVFSCKLMDFGLSRMIERMSQAKTNRIGTSIYMAPEILTTGNYNEKVDVFSYSLLCFVLITEDIHPYGRNNEYNIEMRVANDPNLRPDISRVRRVFEESGDYCRLYCKNNTGEQDQHDWLIKEIITFGWDRDASVRKGFDEISSLIEENFLEKNDGKEKNQKLIPSKKEHEERTTGAQIVVEGGMDDHKVDWKKYAKKLERMVERLNGEIAKQNEKFEELMKDK